MKSCSYRWVPTGAVGALVLSMVLVRCAYVNTFYNARIAFENAQREQKKFRRTNTDSTASIPSSVIANYDRAIAKSKKVLEVYPMKTKWHDDAVYTMGRASFYKEDMPGAIRRLRQLQAEFPNSPFIPESYLYLGKAYMGDDNLLKAEETFSLVLERYPELNADEQVTLLLADLAIRREGKAQAIGLLEKIMKSVTSDEKKIEIILKMAKLYVQLQQYDRAVAVLRTAPRKKEFSGFLYHVDMRLLDCYIPMARYDDALALVERMMKEKRYAGHEDEILLRRGLVYRDRNEAKTAITVFERIAEGKGPAWLRGKAYFELAVIYQRTLGDFDKALTCYEQAKTLSNDDEIVLTATERIDALKWLKANRDSVVVAREVDTSDTAVPTDTDPIAYRIGEVFWLQLEEPESALVHFDALVKDTLTDSSTMTKALYASAWITRHMKGDSAVSDSIFRLVLERSPMTVFAKRAQKELGLAVTVVTREDSAYQAFAEAEDLYYVHANPKDAVNAFYRFANSYSDQKDLAARGLYAAAWLCDNELAKNKVAKKLYTTICDSFPETEYCRNEARPRLRVVEDTLKALREQRKRAPAETGGSDEDDEKGLVGDAETFQPAQPGMASELKSAAPGAGPEESRMSDIDALAREPVRKDESGEETTPEGTPDDDPGAGDEAPSDGDDESEPYEEE